MNRPVLFVLGAIVALVAYETAARDWIVSVTILGVLTLLLTRESTIANDFSHVLKGSASG